MNYYINFSERILEQAKTEEGTSALRKELYYITIGGLNNKVNTDELKLIFWENIYNAYLRIMIKEERLPKDIFKLKRIKISQFILSLNDIEYGILRKPIFKLGFYSIQHHFYPLFIKNLAVKKPDVSLLARLDKNILNQII